MQPQCTAPPRRPFPIWTRAVRWCALGALALTFSLGSLHAGELEAATQAHAQTDGERAAETLRKAQAWLWRQQGEDGGWHSQTYGLLRTGQALTPFILHTLLESDSPAPEGAERKALAFIRARVNPDGMLGLHEDGILEYPVYATSYALRCLVPGNEPADAALIARMRARLAALQFRAENGFEREAYAHGGWGFGTPPKGTPGHMDLAHTRRALEALREAGGLDEAACERARWFLALLQRLPEHPRHQPVPPPAKGALRYARGFDGGFYFSPVVFPANKGGTVTADDGTAYFQSYATATCDGALALLAAGVAKNDPRVAEAKAWLERHASLDLPDGVPAEVSDSYAPSIRYYHLAVRAEAHAVLEMSGPWRKTIAETLAARQRADGRFVNTDSHLMKEDDPLIATALAITALRHCR